LGSCCPAWTLARTLAGETTLFLTALRWTYGRALGYNLPALHQDQRVCTFCRYARRGWTGGFDYRRPPRRFRFRCLRPLLARRACASPCGARPAQLSPGALRWTLRGHTRSVFVFIVLGRFTPGRCDRYFLLPGCVLQLIPSCQLPPSYPQSSSPGGRFVLFALYRAAFAVWWQTSPKTRGGIFTQAGSALPVCSTAAGRFGDSLRTSGSAKQIYSR